MKAFLVVALILSASTTLLFSDDPGKRVEVEEGDPKILFDTSGRHEIAPGLYLEVDKHEDDSSTRFTIGKKLADGSGDAMTHYPLAKEGRAFAFFWEADKKRLWVVSALLIGYFDIGSLSSDEPYEKYDASYLNGHPVHKRFAAMLPPEFEKTVRKFHDLPTKQKLSKP